MSWGGIYAEERNMVASAAEGDEAGGSEAAVVVVGREPIPCTESHISLHLTSPAHFRIEKTTPPPLKTTTIAKPCTRRSQKKGSTHR